jgi:hypothetical protein
VCLVLINTNTPVYIYNCVRQVCFPPLTCQSFLTIERIYILLRAYYFTVEHAVIIMVKSYVFCYLVCTAKLGLIGSEDITPARE